jgi:hypothetical protein
MNEKLVSAVCRHFCGVETIENLDESRKYIEENYQGAYADLGQWAKERFEETGDLESQRGIDLQVWAERRELNDDIFTLRFDDTVHIFLV